MPKMKLENLCQGIRARRLNNMETINLSKIRRYQMLKTISEIKDLARGYEPNSSYIETNNIWKKGKYISEEMDKYFNTVSLGVTERWERFIYN